MTDLRLINRLKELASQSQPMQSLEALAIYEDMRQKRGKASADAMLCMLSLVPLTANPEQRNQLVEALLRAHPRFSDLLARAASKLLAIGAAISLGVAVLVADPVIVLLGLLAVVGAAIHAMVTFFRESIFYGIIVPLASSEPDGLMHKVVHVLAVLTTSAILGTVGVAVARAFGD
jgi:hypothetical protein